MTSRERIIAAINHRQPDMLPIDFGAMRSTGISITAYDNLKKHLKINDKPSFLYDVFQQLAEPEADVLARMGGDVVQLHRLKPAFGLSLKKVKEQTLPSGIKALVPFDYNPKRNADNTQEIVVDARVIAKMPAEGNYFDSVYFPLSNVESMQDLDAYQFDSMTDEEADYLELKARELFENTDKAILFEFGGNILEGGETDFGFEKFMELLLTEPELVHAWAKKKSDSYLKSLKKILPRIAKYINVVQFGDDLGTQDSLIISVDTYREMIMPYHSRMFKYVQENFSDLKVFLHSCGAILPLIPSLIEAGVQILNPVQISAKNMDAQVLKNTFGKDLVFWGGGANMQHTALFGDIAAIKKEVAELITIFAKGGGYVFTQVHNIQSNVPPEKVLAIYDTALSFRK